MFDSIRYLRQMTLNYIHQMKQFFMDFLREMKNTSWVTLFIGLLLTIPTVYFSLQMGYIVGYGSKASESVFVYFITFTLLYSVLVQMGRSLYLITAKLIEAKDSADMVNLCDHLFNLIHIYRNKLLSSYENDDRKLIQYYWACLNISVETYLFDPFLQEITEDPEIINLFRKIELAASQGLSTQLECIKQQNKEKLDVFLDKLNEKFPGLAHLLERRLRGKSLTVQDGLRRSSGFIDRIAWTKDAEKNVQTRYDDAITFLNLCIELLLGREITSLKVKIISFKQLNQIKKRYDEIISDFKLAVRKRNNRIRYFIYQLLKENDDASLLITKGASSEQLYRILIDVVNAEKTAFGYRVKIREEIKKINFLNQKVQRCYKRLRQHEKKYDVLIQKFKKTHRINFKKHIKLYDEIVPFPERKRKKILRQSLQAIKKINTELKYQIDFRTHDEQLLSYADELFDIFDGLLDISEPENSLAIEASQQANFMHIHPEIIPTSKVTLARESIHKMEQNNADSAHTLVDFIVHLIGIPMSEDLVNHLVYEYGADRDYLYQRKAAVEKERDHISSYYREDLLPSILR